MKLLNEGGEKMEKEIILITKDDLKGVSGKEYMQIMNTVDLIKNIRKRKENIK
jgi:hypothetical protein